MKRQISNRLTPFIPIFFFLLGLTIGTAILIVFSGKLSFNGVILMSVASVVFGIVGLFYSKRFYQVSYDSDFLYFSRSRRSDKIALENVSEIMPNVFPLPFFYTNGYIVTIHYRDKEINKRIRFFSKSTFRDVGSVKGIPQLDTLKHLISDKKYGR